MKTPVFFWNTKRNNKLFQFYFYFYFHFSLNSGTAHCANMYEPKETDFPQLIQAREKIREFLHVLLADDDYTM